MHHWGTGWERNAATGMDKTGDTVNARRILMSRSKDVLFWLDDVNPDHGVEQARENLDNVIRQVYNRLGRSRSDRAGEEVSEPTPALASVLITSEFPHPGLGAGTGGAGADGARGDRPGDPAGTRRQRVAAGEGPG